MWALHNTCYEYSEDLVWRMGLLVKCGIAARGMRKVQCGMECVENYCGTVGNMRNAESCPVGGRMSFQTGCRLQGWWWGYIGLATFVCSGDLSCKFQLWKLLNFVTGSSIFQRTCRKCIMKNLMKFMRLSKLKFILANRRWFSYVPFTLRAHKTMMTICLYCAWIRLSVGLFMNRERRLLWSLFAVRGLV